MAIIQERFVLKCRLWWRTYSTLNPYTDCYIYKGFFHKKKSFYKDVSFLCCTKVLLKHKNMWISQFENQTYSIWWKKSQPVPPCQHPMHSMVKWTCFHTADTIHNFSYPIFVNLCTYLVNHARRTQRYVGFCALQSAVMKYVWNTLVGI